MFCTLSNYCEVNGVHYIFCFFVLFDDEILGFSGKIKIIQHISRGDLPSDALEISKYVG